MREYESVFVLNPSVDESQVDIELEKIKDFLSTKNCEITEVQKWGRRKLAYEINKNREGVYTLIRFNADSSVPAELDRRYRLNENMLRYLTVLYERPPIEEGAEEHSEAAAGSDETTAEPKEAKAVETKAVETKAVETKAVETKAVETKAAGEETKEAKAVETKAKVEEPKEESAKEPLPALESAPESSEG